MYLGSGIESGVGLRFEPFSWARHLLWVPAVSLLWEGSEESSWFVYPGHDLMSRGSGISIPRESSPCLASYPSLMSVVTLGKLLSLSKFQSPEP